MLFYLTVKIVDLEKCLVYHDDSASMMVNTVIINNYLFFIINKNSK